MAKSCGIHIGQNRFEVVVLEGSPKKHKITFRRSGEIPPGEDSVAATAQALREATRGKKIPSDNIGLAVGSGLAAYRTISLPFDEKSKIEDVIKFEVENQLPQWNIDDVIVDFHTLSSTPGVESHLQVTAVPKSLLATRIRACEKAGLEPIEAELDTTALFNAAHQAGVLTEDGAQVLVHVGDASIAVVVADGTRLHAMRSIHTGTGRSATEPTPEIESDGGDEEAESSEQDSAEIEKRREDAARRVRRELGRTISATTTDNPIEAIYVTGLPLPGLIGESIQGVAVEPIAFPSGEETPDDGMGAVAYGAALRRLGGGVLGGALRREELRYSGKFERLELPLAVFSLLLVTVLLVHLIVLNKQIAWRGEGHLDRQRTGDLQIWLEASNRFLFPDADIDYPGRLTTPPADILAYAQRAERGEDRERTKFEELQQIERRMRLEIDSIKRELGQISEVVQPQSALEGLTLVLDVVENMGEEVGRFAFRGMDANYVQGRGDTGDYVLVKLDMDFFADSELAATQNYNTMLNRLEGTPWCRQVERKQNPPLENGTGVYVNGLAIQVDVSLAPEEES